MKIHVKTNLNIKDKEARGAVASAAKKALRDVIVLIANDAIKGSPVLTGNNRRSIASEAKGLTASTYSTSGYGGYLEVGTATRAGRPYFKPALDTHLPKLPRIMKEYLG